MRLTQKKPKRVVHHWEDDDARRLWIWACHKPILREHLYHVPNGGKRNSREAARMNGMGVRAGVHDYHLPVARGIFYGLWVELKATPPNDADVTDNQEDWALKMRRQGYAAFVCRGWETAKECFEWYLSLPAPQILLPHYEGLYFNGRASVQI